MTAYRLHIDIAMPLSEAEALVVSQTVITALQSPHLLEELRSREVPSINYRLGHDEDRGKSNYFLKTPSGHVINKKSRVAITEDTHEEVN